MHVFIHHIWYIIKLNLIAKTLYDAISIRPALTIRWAIKTETAESEPLYIEGNIFS